MSGILDKKERVLDFVITENGRSQLQDNDIRIKYASLSDASINYSKNIDLSMKNKSDVSDSEFYYLPLEASPKILSNINPEFSLNRFFSYKSDDVLDLNSLSEAQREVLIDPEDYYNELQKFYQNSSFLSNIKNLKLLTNEQLLNKDVPFRIESSGNDKEIHRFSNTRNYKTIKKYRETANNLPVVCLDKRFSHKKNNKILIPKDISGNELYEKSQFKKINSIISKDNSSGYFLANYVVDNNDDSLSREKEIANIIKSLENDASIYKKEHNIVSGSDRLTLLFEMNEIEHGDDLSKKLLLEKLHFIKIGDFYIDNVLKKVYLIGKIINSRDVDEDLDSIFSFNDGTINLKSNSTFILSAYYSFITMFTLIVE